MKMLGVELIVGTRINCVKAVYKYNDSILEENLLTIYKQNVHYRICKALYFVQLWYTCKRQRP